MLAMMAFSRVADFETLMGLWLLSHDRRTQIHRLIQKTPSVQSALYEWVAGTSR